MTPTAIDDHAGGYYFICLQDILFTQLQDLIKPSELQAVMLHCILLVTAVRPNKQIHNVLELPACKLPLLFMQNIM